MVEHLKRLYTKWNESVMGCERLSSERGLTNDKAHTEPSSIQHNTLGTSELNLLFGYTGIIEFLRYTQVFFRNNDKETVYHVLRKLLKWWEDFE